MDGNEQNRHAESRPSTSVDEPKITSKIEDKLVPSVSVHISKDELKIISKLEDKLIPSISIDTRKDEPELTSKLEDKLVPSTSVDIRKEEPELTSKLEDKLVPSTSVDTRKDEPELTSTLEDKLVPSTSVDTHTDEPELKSKLEDKLVPSSEDKSKDEPKINSRLDDRLLLEGKRLFKKSSPSIFSLKYGLHKKFDFRERVLKQNKRTMEQMLEAPSPIKTARLDCAVNISPDMMIVDSEDEPQCLTQPTHDQIGVQIKKEPLEPFPHTFEAEFKKFSSLSDSSFEAPTRSGNDANVSISSFEEDQPDSSICKTEKIKERNVAMMLCQVCEDLAAGFYCGAYICEACKVCYFIAFLNQLYD